MLSRLSTRSPLVLRVFLTGVSVLAAVFTASAFTLAPAPLSRASLPSYSPSAEAVNTRAFTAYRAAASAVSNRVLVLAGETLSGIAAGMCGSAGDWTGFYAANRSILSNPDVILPGERLQISCTDPGYAPPAPAAPRLQEAAAVTGAYGHPYYCGDGDGDGWDVPCPAQGSSSKPANYAAGANSGTPARTVSIAGDGAFQACVITRESGGNSQVMNASGHYGLYQFSYSTWVGHGGNGADFGHASVAEQNQVFAATVAQDGTSDWAPYDGC
jgi:hypothetical protein